MMAASKTSLLDYFQSTKKLPTAGKRNLEALLSGKEAISKPTAAAGISAGPMASQKQGIHADDFVNNLKRPKSSSDDNNNDSPIQASKRFCAKKQSTLSVQAPSRNRGNVDNTVNKNPVIKALEKPGNRFDRLKQLAANAKETLKQSQNNISSSSSTISESKEIPAYQRFSGLLEDESQGCILPYKYKLLLDTFQSLETVVSMLYNRKELCFAHKIVPSVKQLTRRAFDTSSDLGKIVRVLPEAYHLKLEAVPVNSFYNKKSGQVELTVNPNLSANVDKNAPPPIKGFIPMTPKIIATRKSIFKMKLIEITKLHHEKFLQSLKMSINKGAIRRWHPSFKVDLVADIEAADIPHPDQNNQIATAKEVLEKVRGVYSKRIDDALETVAAAANQSKEEPKPTPIKPAIKGIPQGLLEKIRAKEAAKALSIISRDVESEKKHRMISRLPELARILKTLFVQDQQTSLIAPYVFDKIADSYVETLSPEEIESHLKLLSTLVPEWLSIVNLRDGAMYYKLQRQMDFNFILKKIVAATKA